jgi:maltooligosyltrehalose trehalohydrolase
MLFMGQEWACSSPFLFFADHNEELGKKITEGRRKEFASIPGFADPETRDQIPDPQKEETFQSSKLIWDELGKSEHSGTFQLYQECLRLRNTDPAFRPAGREHWRVEAATWGGATLCFRGLAYEYLIVFDLTGTHTGGLIDPENWQLVLSSEEARFGGTGRSAWRNAQSPLDFDVPEALVLKRKL